jgi:excisionase family DNA binding protein
VSTASYSTIKEFARLLGVEHRTIRRQIKSGEIVAVKIGQQYRINTEAALAALQTGATQ